MLWDNYSPIPPHPRLDGQKKLSTVLQSFLTQLFICCLRQIFRDFREIEVDVYLVGCHGKET